MWVHRYIRKSLMLLCGFLSPLFSENWEDKEVWPAVMSLPLRSDEQTPNKAQFYLYLPSVVASFLSRHRNSSSQVGAGSAVTQPDLHSCSHRNVWWRLRYGEAGWGKEREENENDIRFLCDGFSLWGQGATVIHLHRAVVQKPPPIDSHCLNSYMLI